MEKSREDDKKGNRKCGGVGDGRRGVTTVSGEDGHVVLGLSEKENLLVTCLGDGAHSSLL